MRSLLEEHGLVVTDLDPVLGWLPSAGDPSGLGQADEAEFYAMAEAFGVTTLNAAQPLGPARDREELVAGFAALCDRAAERGLHVTLEFLPWSDVPDVATAWQIVETAGRPNGGLCFDTWHWFRGNRALEPLQRVPGERIRALQINDAPETSSDDLVTETIDDRRLPGEGDIPLAAVLKELRAVGCTAPLGVEVFSSALRELPALEVGRRCGRAARALPDRTGHD